MDFLNSALVVAAAAFALTVASTITYLLYHAVRIFIQVFFKGLR